MMLPRIGSADHAAMVTHDRNPGVVTALAWLAFSHLPDELQSLSAPIYTAAVELLERIPTDSAELTTALNTLVEAKDWAVRAGIRNDYGRPGSVPRPATVVDPPFPAPPKDFPTKGQIGRPPVVDNRIGPNFGRPIQDRPQA
jgi:hypothetical protein